VILARGAAIQPDPGCRPAPPAPSRPVRPVWLARRRRSWHLAERVDPWALRRWPGRTGPVRAPARPACVPPAPSAPTPLTPARAARASRGWRKPTASPL